MIRAGQKRKMSEIQDKNLLQFSGISREELIEDVKRASVKLVEKATENEKYQQEIHELQQKLKASMATHKDLADSNELLEESISRRETEWEKKLNNVTEKYEVATNRYKNLLHIDKTFLVFQSRSAEESLRERNFRASEQLDGSGEEERRT